MIPEQLLYNIQSYIAHVEEPAEEIQACDKWAKYLSDAINEIFDMIERYNVDQERSQNNET